MSPEASKLDDYMWFIFWCYLENLNILRYFIGNNFPSLESFVILSKPKLTTFSWRFGPCWHNYVSLTVQFQKRFTILRTFFMTDNRMCCIPHDVTEYLPQFERLLICVLKFLVYEVQPLYLKINRSFRTDKGDLHHARIVMAETFIFYCKAFRLNAF